MPTFGDCLILARDAEAVNTVDKDGKPASQLYYISK